MRAIGRNSKLTRGAEEEEEEEEEEEYGEGEGLAACGEVIFPRKWAAKRRRKQLWIIRTTAPDISHLFFNIPLLLFHIANFNLIALLLNRRCTITSVP
jgi:hypothetical protein